MEESLTQVLDHAFRLPEKDWKQYSPLTLAYLGDAVFDLAVRMILVKRTNTQTASLHRQATAVVNAVHQAAMCRALAGELTEEEEGVRRRGRNSKPGHTAKNADREEYMEATGFEALIGYLYLSGRYERLTQLICLGLERTGFCL